MKIRFALFVAAIAAAVLCTTSAAATTTTQPIPDWAALSAQLAAQQPKVLAKPLATTATTATLSYNALEHLVYFVPFNIDYTSGMIRQAFANALFQNSAVWTETTAAAADANVIAIGPNGLVATASASSDQQFVVIVDSNGASRTFVRKPLSTSLAAFQELCNMFFDANYVWNTQFGGSYPHTFGYMGICGLGFSVSFATP